MSAGPEQAHDSIPVRVQAPCSVVILAGGQSRRLGRDKSLLQFQGQSLLERAVSKLASLSDDLVVVTNNEARCAGLALPVRYVPDERRGVGSLMGVYSGLKAARHPHALVVACDMPFLSLPLLRYMLSRVGGYDVVVPYFGSFFEPLHAVYSKECLPAMARLLEQNRRQIIAFFPDVRVRHVTEAEIDRFDPDRLTFLNINTQEDWERVHAVLGSDGSSA